MAKSTRKPFQTLPAPQNREALPLWAEQQFRELQDLVNELLQRVEDLESP